MALLPAPDRPGVFGDHTIAELPRIVRERGLSRILLVTGKQSFTSSGAAEILPSLRQAAEVEIWSDFAPNPEVSDLVAGARIVAALQPDGIVAIGGGSVLDMAKLLTVFGDTDPARIADGVRGNAVTERRRTLILVPTTSGSGSEATHFAVAYIGEEKFSVAHPSLLPDYVVLDPSLTASASRYQKATSVIDAFAQAVESHWARGADSASRAFAVSAMHDLAGCATAFLDGDADATVQAARGSHLAGRAIDISKTTGPHALAYGLTKRHGISHGHAVATTLGTFARLHARTAAAGRGSDGLNQDLSIVADAIGAASIDDIGDQIDRFARDLGLELRLSALGVPRSDLALMASTVNVQRLGNNPVELTEGDIVDVLNSCW